MNTSELQTFLAIAETGSLARAARRVNVTPSTVTARLQSLEEELGDTLFHRDKAGARLTAAGHRFHRYADTITGLWRQARQEGAMHPGLRDSCTFACHPNLWEGPGMALFGALADQPGLALNTWQGRDDDIARDLVEGACDVALSYRPNSDPRLRQITLPDERLVLVASEPDAPTQHNPTYVYVDHGEDFARDHDIAYSQAGVARMSFGTASAARAYLLAEGGSAYLPQRMINADVTAGRLHRIDAPMFRRPVYVLRDRRTTDGWAWLPEALATLALFTSV